jgi:hypothetical protein
METVWVSTDTWLIAAFRRCGEPQEGLSDLFRGRIEGTSAVTEETQLYPNASADPYGSE